MSELEVRKLGLIPYEDRTVEEREWYHIYCTARDCVTGSMVNLYNELEMPSEEFYSRLDSDLAFRTAITQGLSDARQHRLLELESSLIRLALGTTVTDQKTDLGADGVTTTTTVKELAPNLQALQILLEKYQGSSWSVSQRVIVDSEVARKEIDYSILSKDQLKQLASGGKEDVKDS